MQFNRIFTTKVGDIKRTKHHLVFKDVNEESDESSIKDLTRYCDSLSKSQQAGAMFDARAFILPKEEVVNYFIWRQQDATRNSILMVAQSCFSHKEMQGIKCDALQEKLFSERNINWNDYTIPQKRGTCIRRQTTLRNDVERHEWIIDTNIPIFTQDKDYINKLVFGEQTNE